MRVFSSSRLIRRLISLLVVLMAIATWLAQSTSPSASKASVETLLHHTNNQTLPFGWPVVTQSDAEHDIQLLNNRCYSVGYSNQRGNPLWVTYLLTDKRDGQVDKRQDKFITDNRTSARIVHEHYSRSGYDRGHMAPNSAIGQLCDDEAQKETFLMSNITPQSKSLNQRWWERLERVELNFFTKRFKEVWVIDGPVFDRSPVNLPHGPVQVPSKFYKVYLAQKQNQWHVLAFLVGQEVEGSEPLSQYRTSIQQIEQLIGFDLLPSLGDEMKRVLKSDTTDDAWHLSEVDLLPARY